MKMEILSVFRCPVCAAPLRREGKSLVCTAGHTFDIARSGYANMLPPGKERNARAGDEKAMVSARAAFLALGYYSGISQTAAELTAEALPDGEVLLCDMGCGEGYHSCTIAETTAEKRGMPVTMLGFDASKYAAECACRLAVRRGLLSREGIGAAWDSPVQACFLPGNLFHLPLADGCCGAAFSLFAPTAGEEAHRILKPHGLLTVVSAGRDHLSELRELIYSEVRRTDAQPQTPAGFSERLRTRLTYPIELDSREAIRNLFVMTPFYYRTTEEGRERLLSRDSLSVTADVVISLFEAE